MLKENLISREEFERLNDANCYRVITSEFIENGEEAYRPHNIGKCCLGKNPLQEYKSLAKSKGETMCVWVHMSSEPISTIIYDSESYIQLWIDGDGEIDYSHIYHEEN